jgi:hypothetical protein
VKGKNVSAAVNFFAKRLHGLRPRCIRFDEQGEIFLGAQFIHSDADHQLLADVACRLQKLAVAVVKVIKGTA